MRSFVQRMAAVAAGFVGLATVGIAEGVWNPFSVPVVFFPPGAPVFGDRIAEPMVREPDRATLQPPEEMAAYVNESFYPALGSRRRADGVSNRLENRLDEFRAKRGALINELADQLVALHNADDETRETELRVFAEKQSPKILALEREAEELRRDLIDGNVLQRSVDWSKKRAWVLGVTNFRQDYLLKDAHYQVARAAAFYQDGLLTEQRGMLLEIALELRNRARAARPVPGPKIGDPSAMFFSPATSRLRLPKKMSPELVTLIGRYNGEKTALKQELYDTLVAQDKSSRSKRAAAFEALADRQWPRLIELEKVAEQIRGMLAATPRERLAAPPHLPAGLMVRIEAYQKDRQQFLDEFQQTMDAASAIVRWNPEQRMTIRAKVAEAFHERTRERFQEMRQRYDGIQADLTLVAAGQFDPETGRPLTAETLLRNYSVANEKFDTFGREEVIYSGYRTAMLMPGLSVEQRRLLFGAALVGLAQSLPFGEMAPSSSLPVPRS